MLLYFSFTLTSRPSFAFSLSHLKYIYVHVAKYCFVLVGVLEFIHVKLSQAEWKWMKKYIFSFANRPTNHTNKLFFLACMNEKKMWWKVWGKLFTTISLLPPKKIHTEIRVVRKKKAFKNVVFILFIVVILNIYSTWPLHILSAFRQMCVEDMFYIFSGEPKNFHRRASVRRWMRVKVLPYNKF